jgi:hypothetical protein
MTTVSSPSPSSAVESVPLSAMAIAEPPAPAPEPAPTWLDRLLQRIQPATAYGMLFLMGLSGGLGVATAASLTIRYLTHGSDKQLAAVRFVLPRQALEPLDVEIQKAKAELDAAVAPHGS